MSDTATKTAIEDDDRDPFGEFIPTECSRCGCAPCDCEGMDALPDTDEDDEERW